MIRLVFVATAFLAPLNAIHGGNNMRYSWHIMAPIKVCNGGFVDDDGVTQRYPYTKFATREHKKAGVDHCMRCGATWITKNSLLTAAHCFMVDPVDQSLKDQWMDDYRHRIDDNAALSVFLLKDQTGRNWNNDRSKYNNYELIDDGGFYEDSTRSNGSPYNKVISSKPNYSYDKVSRATYVLHPGFYMGHDIAVININKAQPNVGQYMTTAEAYLHRVLPVDLPTLCDYNDLYDYIDNYGTSKYGSKSSPSATSFGFGDTGSLARDKVREMRKVNIELKKPTECLGLKTVIDTLGRYNTICAKSRYGAGSDYQGICQGDSGGPGIVKKLPGRNSMLFGISSQCRPTCPPPEQYGHNNSPQQFTSVAHYREWISENTIQTYPYHADDDCNGAGTVRDIAGVIKDGGDWVKDGLGGVVEGGGNMLGDAVDGTKNVVGNTINKYKFW